MIKHLDKYVFYDDDSSHSLAVIVGDYSGIMPKILLRDFNNVMIYEASKTNFKKLVENTEGFPIYTVNKAVTGQIGTTMIYEYDTPSSNSIFAIKDKEIQQRVIVESVSVETIIEENGKIDFMLLNCEGSEYGIIDEILEKKLDVGQICVSLHNISAAGIIQLIERISELYRVKQGNIRYNYWLFIKR